MILHGEPDLIEFFLFAFLEGFESVFPLEELTLQFLALLDFQFPLLIEQGVEMRVLTLVAFELIVQLLGHQVQFLDFLPVLVEGNIILTALVCELSDLHLV